MQSEGGVTDFTTLPHIIPLEILDQPLLKADQALLMHLHWCMKVVEPYGIKISDFYQQNMEWLNEHVSYGTAGKA